VKSVEGKQAGTLTVRGCFFAEKGKMCKRRVSFAPDGRFTLVKVQTSILLRTPDIYFANILESERIRSD
jgi:hypothetical protein